MKGLDDINKFIEKEIMPNQFKYILYIVGGLVGLLLLLSFMK